MAGGTRCIWGESEVQKGIARPCTRSRCWQVLPLLVLVSSISCCAGSSLEDFQCSRLGLVMSRLQCLRDGLPLYLRGGMEAVPQEADVTNAGSEEDGEEHVEVNVAEANALDADGGQQWSKEEDMAEELAVEQANGTAVESSATGCDVGDIGAASGSKGDALAVQGEVEYQPAGTCLVRMCVPPSYISSLLPVPYAPCHSPLCPVPFPLTP